ncbi:amino acid permease-domain-containing protein [Chytriomyces sp. MP71]|nr:amino acid permease-domain-containing protein [Chytriomyces sp. MP71]
MQQAFSANALSSMSPFKNLITLKHKDNARKRRLMSPSANWIHIWGFVTGAVISGEFSGFNTGYSYGLGSMIVAHTLMCCLMITVSLNLVELTLCMPFASGCAAWAKAAFGGPAGCLIGMAYTLDMVFIGAEVTQFLGLTMTSIFSGDVDLKILYWLLTIGFCWTINLHPKVFFNTITAMSAISVVLVVAPLLVCIQDFDFSLAWETVMPDGSISRDFLPFGVMGVAQSCATALYLLICFEALPVIIEETSKATKNIQRGMIAANVTLLGVSWISLVVCAGMKPGVKQLAFAQLPYTAIITAAYPHANEQAINLVNIPGIFASQLAIYYACTRYIYGLSRSGYLPQVCSLTNRWGSPWVSMIVTNSLWFIFSLIYQFIPIMQTEGIFLALGTIFAMTAYLVQPLVYLKLHYSMVSLPRPFKIPFGLGPLVAIVNFLIACAGIMAMVAYNTIWRWCLLGILAGYAFITPFYFFFIKQNLENSPEKIFMKEQMKMRINEQVEDAIFAQSKQSSRPSSVQIFTSNVKYSSRPSSVKATTSIVKDPLVAVENRKNEIKSNLADLYGAGNFKREK